MTDYLVFTLTANLASMGGLAGHERRGSLDWPGRSAIIGLLGAALGWRRDADFSPLDGLQIAVAVFDAGTPLRDYHTVQTVPSAKVRRPQSRPEALRAARLGLNTIITLRDYRCTPLYGVALCGVEESMLRDLRQALMRPVFTLYLGRKSCPLAAPLAPRIVAADDPGAALAQVVLPPWRGRTVARRMLADSGMVDAPAHRERRNDVAVDRRRWHFTAREVAVERVHIQPEVAP
ncbi:MAG: type I-E CRISPR-associated protein Cas5/CasD [Burkholderiaceae bacterium]|jgi:CRISPR system Cascade subunit CasD|nr:MAG: type I-E CRISPR-associated protein Cas5/CasD [Burkholderiaceae bacterium]